MGRALKRDFERNGVHLSPGAQQKLATLVQGAHETGVQFGERTQEPRCSAEPWTCKHMHMARCSTCKLPVPSCCTSALCSGGGLAGLEPAGLNHAGPHTAMHVKLTQAVCQDKTW